MFNKTLKTVIGLTFCLASTFFYSFFIAHTYRGGTLVTVDGDAEQYVGSAESLFTKGEFVFFRTDSMNYVSNLALNKPYDKGIYYAFRTPGFLFVYLPVRAFLNQHAALVFVIILQIFLIAIAKFLIARIAEVLSGGKTAAFIAALLLVNLLPHFSYLTDRLLTEAQATSFLIFSFAIVVLKGERFYVSKKLIFFSGFFLMLAIYLRPFLLLVMPAMVLYFVYKKRLTKTVLFLFLLPVMVVEPVWVIRNYVTIGEFIPLSKTLEVFDYHHLSFKEQRELCKDLGTSAEWWEKESLMYWFAHPEDTRPAEELMPEKFLKLANNRKLISEARTNNFASVNPSVSLQDRITHERQSAMLISECRANYKTEYSMDVLIGSRLKTFWRFLDMHPFKFWISARYPINVLTVFAESALYWALIIVGFAACAHYVLVKRNAMGILLAYIPAYIVAFFSFVIGLCEHREMFIPHFILAVLASAYLGDVLLSRKYKTLIWVGVLLIMVFAMAAYTTRYSIKW